MLFIDKQFLTYDQTSVHSITPLDYVLFSAKRRDLMSHRAMSLVFRVEKEKRCSADIQYGILELSSWAVSEGSIPSHQILNRDIL